MQVNIQEGIIAEVHRFMTLDRETVRTFHESVIRIMELFGFDVHVDHLPQIYLRRGEDFKGRRAYLDFDFMEIHVQSDGRNEDITYSIIHELVHCLQDYEEIVNTMEKMEYNEENYLKFWFEKEALIVSRFYAAIHNPDEYYGMRRLNEVWAKLTRDEWIDRLWSMALVDIKEQRKKKADSK